MGTDNYTKEEKNFYQNMMEEIRRHQDFGKRNPVDIGIDCGYSEDDVMEMIYMCQGAVKEENKTAVKSKKKVFEKIKGVAKGIVDNAKDYNPEAAPVISECDQLLNCVEHIFDMENVTKLNLSISIDYDYSELMTKWKDVYRAMDECVTMGNWCTGNIMPVMYEIDRMKEGKKIKNYRRKTVEDVVQAFSIWTAYYSVVLYMRVYLKMSKVKILSEVGDEVDDHQYLVALDMIKLIDMENAANQFASLDKFIVDWLNNTPGNPMYQFFQKT